MPSGGHVAGAAASPTRALVLATISFALSFAAWGLVGGLASVFTGLYALTASQTALLVAVPVLLGSLARLPMGMLTDRFGGRLVFTALLAFSVARRVRRAADRQLRLAARRGVPHRHGRIVVRGRRRLRVPLDAGGPAGHGARRLRARDAGAVAGRLRRPGRRGPPRLGSGVSRHRRAAPRLGGRVLRCWRGIPRRPARPATRRRDDGGPAARADRLAARRVLLPDLRRLRRVLDLPADAAARAVRPGARRRRIPRGRLRRARDADAAGRRLAGGSDRRRAGPVVGLRRRRAVLAAPDVAVDGAVHGRRARVRDADGTGQRRGLQAGAGALPEGHRHGDRPRRRARRSRRVLPAAAARRLPRSRSASSGRASCCCPRPRSLLRVGQPARVPPGRRRVDAVAAGGRASGARARPGRRVGRARHGHAGGGDRRRLAQPAALRRGARRLHVRDALRDVRHQLSLRDVAAASADAHVLAARLAGVLLAARAGRQHASASAAARCWSSPPTASSSGAAGCAGSRTG